MRHTNAGGSRALRVLLLLGVLVAAPVASAAGPGASESTPAQDHASDVPANENADQGSSTTTSDTEVGPPGQGCRPMCL